MIIGYWFTGGSQQHTKENLGCSLCFFQSNGTLKKANSLNILKRKPKHISSLFFFFLALCFGFMLCCTFFWNVVFYLVFVMVWPLPQSQCFSAVPLGVALPLPPAISHLQSPVANQQETAGSSLKST